MKSHFKSVLIFGPGFEKCVETLKSLTNKPNYLIIGDGKKSISKDDLEILKGNIAAYTRIDAIIHGGTYNNKHYLKLDNIIRTSEFFDSLRHYSQVPLQLYLWSCYGSISSIDVSALGEGSMLFSVHKEHEMFEPLVRYIIENSSAKYSSPISNFIDNLALNLYNIRSLSVCVDGKCHELALNPPLVEVIAKPIETLHSYRTKVLDFFDTINKSYKSKDRQIDDIVADDIGRRFSRRQIKAFRVGSLIYNCYTFNIEALQQVIASNNKMFVKRIVSANINSISPLIASVTPLAISSKIKVNPEIIKMLVSCNADVNQAKEDGTTSLFYAAANANIDFVQLLIASKANVNIEDGDGNTVLLRSAAKGFVKVVEILIKNKACVNHINKAKFTALWIAAKDGYGKVVELLVRNNASIDLVGIDGSAPLYIAVQKGHKDVVKYLLTNNADVNKACSDTTLLYMAVQKNRLQVSELLIKHNADVNAVDYNGTTVLLKSAADGYAEIVKMLIRNKACVNHINDDKVSALWIAAQNGHGKVVELLVRNNASIDFVVDGSTPLYIAAQNGHKDVVKYLLTNNADVNKACSDTTPLYMAVQNNHLQVSELLIKHKADLYPKTSSGKAARDFTISDRHQAIVEALEKAMQTRTCSGVIEQVWQTMFRVKEAVYTIPPLLLPCAVFWYVGCSLLSTFPLPPILATTALHFRDYFPENVKSIIDGIPKLFITSQTVESWVEKIAHNFGSQNQR